MNLKDAGIYDLENIFKGKATAAHNISQGGIINNLPRIINIPAYQRPYRWSSDNIRRLFSDYDESRSEYFIGSAVVVEKVRNGTFIEFDVVDGQQRMTTLYLMNFIRYLLKREFILEALSKPYQPKSTEYCNSLKECYVDLIGKNTKPFDNILYKLEELSNESQYDNNPEERVKKLIECYKRELCIPEDKTSPSETMAEKLNKAHEFFDKEQLCLKYSRNRYDNILREALCVVYLNKISNTINYELDVVINDKDQEFSKNYIEAMKTIFNEIWERALKNISKKNPSRIDVCEEAIKFADEFIKNMAICIVLTENENDANKLFEVLNDRSLEVEDLELIKNHFYKEYCTKSNDSDDIKDKNIAILDELWADKIFSGNSTKKNRLISYLSAVYLTCDTDLSYKDDFKFKTAIENKYTSKNNVYEFQSILADFNAYYAVKKILDKFNIQMTKTAIYSLNAEQDELKSISYKTMHLLNALGYISVMPALINVIIATYQEKYEMNSITFESDFDSFIDCLLADNKHINNLYGDIHKCAYMLWIAAIKAKDYNIPRDIAKRIIKENGHVGLHSQFFELLSNELKELNNEFDEWINSWSYTNGNGKLLIIKILMLHLLLSDRNPKSKGYMQESVEVNLNTALSYKLDASNLQLDHLEANKIDYINSSKYYLSNDLEKRQKDVNNYLGNFMILDAKDNNQKNNVPLNQAIKFYDRISKSWMVDDIKEMIAEDKYFDKTNGIPYESFFNVRSKQLKEYFKAFLNNDLNTTSFKVNL